MKSTITKQKEMVVTFMKATLLGELYIDLSQPLKARADIANST